MKRTKLPKKLKATTTSHRGPRTGKVPMSKTHSANYGRGSTSSSRSSK
jgi:hypothetical protein